MAPPLPPTWLWLLIVASHRLSQVNHIPNGIGFRKGGVIPDKAERAHFSEGRDYDKRRTIWGHLRVTSEKGWTGPGAPIGESRFSFSEHLRKYSRLSYEGLGWANFLLRLPLNAK